jgi:hypothetical protein
MRGNMDHLLLVQGPLLLDWSRRKWGVLPRVENSDLGPVNPPTLRRFKQWSDTHIGVEGAESWCFIKLHTHGAPERNHASVLGAECQRFHDELLQFAKKEGFRLHYVSSREMVNIIHAAEDGHQGDAGLWRNYLFQPPPNLQD